MCLGTRFHFVFFLDPNGEVCFYRTGLYDSGIGRTIFEMLMRDDPDRRVLVAVLMVCCNILNQYSPMREVGVSFLLYWYRLTNDDTDVYSGWWNGEIGGVGRCRGECCPGQRTVGIPKCIVQSDVGREPDGARRTGMVKNSKACF